MSYLYHAYEPYDGSELTAMLLKQVKQHFTAKQKAFVKAYPQDWAAYEARFQQVVPVLLKTYFDIYSDCVTAYPQFSELLRSVTNSWFERSDALRALDDARVRTPDWFRSNQMAGGVAYVDLFAGDLQKFRKKLPYFQELGLNYIHLMPLFKSPEGENDGGYAISSYREVDPDLGTIAELRELIADFHQAGISIVLDFVFNHTSDEHEWARWAKRDDAAYQHYYWMFADRDLPDQFERSLREIFPDEHPGAFTYFPKIKRWVWTTFHSYQWDLNYQNPEVFLRMAEEMLFLANLGVDVLRLDAVAFIWKQMGTTCESQPNAYRLVEAFNLVARLAAPSLLFKSEAIVHPDEVIRYIGAERCQISYNPLLMALMWESLATRETKLLRESMRRRFNLPAETAWVNYIRCHDDIGWTFSDEDAAAVGIHGGSHRAFLNRFYTGRFPGSFALGLPFQENPKTGDCRISGTLASLAGLEKALAEHNEVEIEFSIRRILLLFGVISTIGGIPLIYLGDEVGMLNCYAEEGDELRQNDSRWVHRCPLPQALYDARSDAATPAGKIWQGVRHLLELRQSHPIFSMSDVTIAPQFNRHLFAYRKEHAGQVVICVANFSEHLLSCDFGIDLGITADRKWTDLITGAPVLPSQTEIQPYQFLCILSDKRSDLR